MCQIFSRQIEGVFIEETKISTKSTSSGQWVKCGLITLCQTEKSALLTGKWLTDLHIKGAQLLRNQFKHLGGLAINLAPTKRLGPVSQWNMQSKKLKTILVKHLTVKGLFEESALSMYKDSTDAEVKKIELTMNLELRKIEWHIFITIKRIIRIYGPEGCSLIRSVMNVYKRGMQAACSRSFSYCHFCVLSANLQALHSLHSIAPDACCSR